MNPWVVVAGIVAVGGLYALLPVIAEVYFRFRGPRSVSCPETGTTATVEVNAGQAALSALVGPPVPSVRQCSLWPERHACAEACMQSAAGSR